MQAAAHATVPNHRGRVTHTCTLYELIEAISDEVNSNEEGLIAVTVKHLFDSGRVRLLCNDNDFGAQIRGDYVRTL